MCAVSPIPVRPGTDAHADQAWDDYQARVLRNEERLRGLEQSVNERIETDRSIAEQRAESLSAELQRRADEVEALALERRAADRREYRERLAAHELAEIERWAAAVNKFDAEAKHLATLALVYDEKHNAEIERRIAGDEKLEALVTGWRESDERARLLQAEEYARRLDVLNHAHERQQEFQNRAVTRELFASEKEAQLNREAVLREQILTLDRAMLGMMPSSRADAMRTEIGARSEAALESVRTALNIRLDGLSEKVDELKQTATLQAGKGAGVAAFYGWIAAAVGMVLSVVIIVNILTSK